MLFYHNMAAIDDRNNAMAHILRVLAPSFRGTLASGRAEGSDRTGTELRVSWDERYSRLKHKTYHGRRLRLYDLLDLLKHRRRELGDNVECLEVINDLIRPGCAEDDSGRVLFNRDPRKSEVGDSAPEL